LKKKGHKSLAEMWPFFVPKIWQQRFLSSFFGKCLLIANFLSLIPTIILSIAQDEPLVWPFYTVMVLFALGICISFLDTIGGPIINTFVAFFQQIYHVITKRPFKMYPQWNKRSLPFEKRKFLFEQVHFYKFLIPTERKAFDHRVVKFLESREFEGRENVVITEQMKLLISATAVQISFGLRSYLIKEFAKIVVYPSAYYNKLSRRYHKGEVNPNGIVILNWEDFYHGIQIPDDNLNLGIHEFAHTLAVQRLKNRAFRDEVFVKLFDVLMRSAAKPAFRAQMQEHAGLRKYAQTNNMEFFAVATESFFENPEQLYKNEPKIYTLFAQMYNQELISLYRRAVTPLTNLHSQITT